MNKNESHNWVKKAQEGDRAAFTALVQTHQALIYSCAYQYMKNKTDAEDATQETFLKAYKSLASFDFRAEFGTWLYRICVNHCLNLIRAKKPNQSTDVEGAIELPGTMRTQESTLEDARMEQRLREALQGLSEALRNTVILVMIEGLPQQEAAEILGCSVGTVAWRVHEARKLLAHELKELLPEDLQEQYLNP